MDVIIERVISESNIINLVLLVGVVYLWRELKQERSLHIQTLKSHLDIHERLIGNYESFKNVLENLTIVIKTGREGR